MIENFEYYKNKYKYWQKAYYWLNENFNTEEYGKTDCIYQDKTNDTQIIANNMTYYQNKGREAWLKENRDKPGRIYPGMK